MDNKDDRIGFRIPAEVKSALMAVANKEGRSLAQVCELFLRAGLLAYKREGAKYIQRSLEQRAQVPKA